MAVRVFTRERSEQNSRPRHRARQNLPLAKNTALSVSSNSTPALAPSLHENQQSIAATRIKERQSLR
ncbi:MAG: hypothetical protein EBY32_09945 [Proteobacteria bacterium]|nr:hypothetical protein [Pseudomonadota bacterium]